MLLNCQDSINYSVLGKILLHMLKTGLEVSVPSGLIRENNKKNSTYFTDIVEAICCHRLVN